MADVLDFRLPPRSQAVRSRAPVTLELDPRVASSALPRSPEDDATRAVAWCEHNGVYVIDPDVDAQGRPLYPILPIEDGEVARRAGGVAGNAGEAPTPPASRTVDPWNAAALLLIFAAAAYCLVRVWLS